MRTQRREVESRPLNRRTDSVVPAHGPVRVWQVTVPVFPKGTASLQAAGGEPERRTRRDGRHREQDTLAPPQEVPVPAHRDDAQEFGRHSGPPSGGESEDRRNRWVQLQDFRGRVSFR